MKRSRIISLMLIVTVVALSILSPEGIFSTREVQAASAEASDEIVTAAESDFEYILAPKSNPKYALVQKYTGTDKKIIIPEAVGGYPVKILSANVFSECNNLTYIKIPANVTSVSGRTFAECRSLLEIDIDPANTYYTAEDGILYNYDKTSLIAFPNGIGGAYTVPEGIITIGSYAFCGAYKLTEVNMYNTVTAISESAFQGCIALSQIRLSDCLSVLGKKALANCVDLRELHLPASLSVIGEDAILGDMGSRNDKFYYFTDGVYCVPESAAYDYVYALGVRVPYLKTESRTVTDITTGIKIIDSNAVLPLDKSFSIKITPVITDEVSDLVPVRYSYIEAYDIALTYNGENYAPLSELIIQFNNLPENNIVSATKVYRTDGTRVFELQRSPHTPFVAAQTKNLGRYIVISNNDFSKKGDIDGDNVVSSYDARFALCLAAGIIPSITPEQSRTADIDESGSVSTEDARDILRIASGILSFD